MRITGVVSEELLVEQMKEVTLLHDNIVKPYEPAEVDIREIDLSEVRPTTLYVLRDNLIFQKNLKEKLALQGVDPLAMDGGVILGDAEESVGMIPPIVELDEEFGPCLIDGQHRSFLGREAGRKTMKVLYIAGANPEYPIYAYPNAWEDVAICDSVPEKKKHYRMEDPAFLYRDFSALNGSSMRPVA